MPTEEDGEGMTQIGDTTHQTARKPHVCWWCGETIETGERYVRWLWKDGNTCLPTKVHNECKRAWDSLDHDDCDFIGADVVAYNITPANQEESES